MSLIARLARVVTMPHWRSHALRTLLTVVGVSLGVTTVVGIADVSKSVLESFRGMIDAVAGETTLEVSSPIGVVPEEVVATVRGVGGVAHAAGVLERFVPMPGPQSEQVYLLGVDFLGSPVWERQFPRDAIDIEDELLFLSQLDSVVLPRALVERRGLDLSSRVTIMTSSGPRELTVRGTMSDAPAARLFDGAVALMDLPAAQRLLGAEGMVDRIAITVRDGVGESDVAARLRTAVGPAYRVSSPESRGERVQQLMFSLRTTLAIMSLGAVIVGAFIVYHTVAISILQRRRHFALLNACGVGRRTLVQLCVIETLALATPGVLLGLMAGKLVASLASGLVGATVSEIWARVDVATLSWSAWGAGVGVVVGIGTALASALVAIRQTFAAPTVEALRPVGLSSEAPGAMGGRLAAGLVLVAGVWLITLAPRELGFVGTVSAVIGTQVLGYVGIALLAAPLVWGAGLWARRVVGGDAPLPVRLAAENLPRSPGRSAGIVATIGATMAIAMIVFCLVRSFESAWIGWVEQHFGADLFVGSGGRVRLMAGTPMDSGIAERVRGVAGVQSVERFRTIPIDLDGRPVFLQGLSLADRLAHGGLPMVEGTLEAAAAALGSGAAVLLSENLAYRMALNRGDEIAVPTPRGDRRFEIAGVYVDYLGSLDHGAIVVDERVLSTVWGDDRANLLRVWLEPGVTARHARGALLAELGTTSGYFVLTAGEFIDGIRAVIHRFFAATWALEIVAALVGVIGVINTQLANVLDREGEIRVLRTIGVTRRDVVGSVVAECGALGAMGGALGVTLGLIFAAQIVLVSLRLVTGWSMPFVVPPWPLVGALVLATGVSALAGYVPARSAADLSVGQRSVD